MSYQRNDFDEDDDLFDDPEDYSVLPAAARYPNRSSSASPTKFGLPYKPEAQSPFQNPNSYRGLSSYHGQNSYGQQSHHGLNVNYSPFHEADEMYEEDQLNSMSSGQFSKLKRSKGVAFADYAPEYPSVAYLSHNTLSVDDHDQMDPLDSVGRLHFGYNTGFNGDDYVTNELEDADDDDDIDPFGDDESLFSETGEELLRRGTTIKRSNTKRGSLRKGNGKASGTTLFENEYDEDDDLQPRLNYTKTIKKAKLVAGNYVIDCPVPKALLKTFGRMIQDGNREMTFMRYTAATCGPSNYGAFKYSLRQSLYSPRRETEIMVCITMYNEDEVLLARTLKGVFENIADLNSRKDPTWGEGSWKKVVVTIICDGRIHLHERSQKLMAAMGCYQDGYAKSKINERGVKAHIYEYTSTVGIDVVNDRVHLGPNSNPVQFLFCVKEHNAKKINSHRWAFQAFGNDLKPKVVMLLDCGTRPNKDAFYYLWRSFRDPNVAGACGEMRAALGPNHGLLINPFVAAQNFEYKIANILDKPMESVFGFITVLPGAFSAYRYEALLNVEGQGPLEKYFKGEYLTYGSQICDEDDDEREVRERNYHEAGIFSSNMYLAEDRILCFELVAKRGHNYVLRYVNEAKAETDVPENIDEFILQRRRWLNGSMFAAWYSLCHWTSIWRLNHSLSRKLVLQLEFYYQLVTSLVSWFSLASFFLVFRILTANLGADDVNFVVGKYLAVLMLWLYVACVVSTFVLAFGNTPRGTKRFYLLIACVFAALMAYMMFAAIYLAVFTIKSVLSEKGKFHILDLFTNSKFRDLVVSMGGTYVLYFVGAFMYGNPSFMFTSFIQYVLLSPSYINILNIYSFCNIHDVSWGTKGVEQAKDLGLAKSSGVNKDELVMIAPGVLEELNETYLHSLDTLRTLPVVLLVQVANAKKFKDDSYYAFVRSMTVLVWMLTNAILVAVVLEIGGVDLLMNTCGKAGITANSAYFLSVILWVVAGLACYRFFGCTLYLIFKGMRPLKWKMKAMFRRNTTTL